MRKIAILLAAAASLAAQDYYPRHNLSFGIGAAQPRGDLNSIFLDRPAIAASYGYRFSRYFQVDFGLDTVFGAAGVRDYVETGLGYSKIRDFQFLLPMGGRVILPFAGGRVLFHGGGGGAWMHYSERIHQISDYYQLDCPFCTARSGWGYYAQLGLDVFLDRGQHWRIGAVSKVYRGHTDGEPLGAAPAGETRDHWITTFAQFGFSF